MLRLARCGQMCLTSICLLLFLLSYSVGQAGSAMPSVGNHTTILRSMGWQQYSTAISSLRVSEVMNATSSTLPPPPLAGGMRVFASTRPVGEIIPGKAPVGTPFIGPNGSLMQPTPIPSTNHWWDIIYYSQTASDYGGQFVAQANNINGYAFCLTSCSDDLLILPLNIALGSSTNSVWFQFDIDFYHSCSLGFCSQGVNWYIWNNPNPTGACGSSISYNYNAISLTSSFSNTALSYTPGDSYHWDFYPAVSPSNTIVFLIVDDSKGGVPANAFWWYEWQVPTLSLLYSGNCFSPATAVEGYTDSSTTSLSNVPSYQFREGYPSENYGSSYITGPPIESCYSCAGAKPSGISETMYQIDSTGDWYWLIYQSGLQTTLFTAVDSGIGSVSPNCPGGCSETVGSSITVTATAGSGWQFSSWSTQNGQSCSSNPCVFSMPNNQVTLEAAFSPQASMVSSVIFSASAGSDWFIGNTNPYDNQALLGVWAEATSSQNIGLWTSDGWADKTTGRPLVSGNLVLVAGPLANKVTGYYQSQSLTVAFRWGNINGVSYAQIVNRGQVLAQMRENEIGTGKDIFVVQTIRDSDGRLVLMLWGIGAQGTLASGIWFVSNYSTMGSFSNSIYVYSWADTNGDTFPQPNEITLSYQGN